MKFVLLAKKKKQQQALTASNKIAKNALPPRKCMALATFIANMPLKNSLAQIAGKMAAHPRFPYPMNATATNETV